MEMEYDLCHTNSDSDEIKHLPLYVFGSEGINVCLQCRIILTSVASGLRSTANKAYKNGYLNRKNTIK